MKFTGPAFFQGGAGIQAQICLGLEKSCSSAPGELSSGSPHPCPLCLPCARTHILSPDKHPTDDIRLSSCRFPALDWECPEGRDPV